MTHSSMTSPRPSRLRSDLSRAAILAILMLSCPYASFAAVVPLTVEQMTDEAHSIVEARVVNVRSRWNESHDQIYSFVTLQVISTLKGDGVPSVLRFRLLGGAADGIGMFCPDDPSFRVGEEEILFLQRNPQSFDPIVGLAQGQFILTRDRNGHEARATNGFGHSLPSSVLIARIANRIRH